MRGQTMAWLAALLLGVATQVQAQVQDVPPALRDWQSWVLHDDPAHGCPFLATRMPPEARQCAWPGRLALQADAGGGRFGLDVHVDAPSWVALPGDATVWPTGATDHGTPLAVLEHDGGPALWLTPGDHALSASLPWQQRPARLAVPTSIGLIDLRVDGQAVAAPERNEGQLTLGEASALQRAADALSLRVYRRLDDGLPPMLDTRVQLTVSGSAREVLLGPTLPAGFVATALSGDLPARLESDGRLRVQLRPGTWTLDLNARAVAPLTRVAPTAAPAPWPWREIWSYADATDLRASRAEGVPTDPAQAGVPDEWAELPAFVVDPTHALTVTPGARGDEGAGADQVQVQRELWLDFDGRGLTVADRLTGTLHHPRRLDVAPPWQLGRASQDDSPLLVTQGTGGATGVELRARELALDAGLRLAGHAGRLPAGGWQLPLDRIDATLHLPAGARLLGSAGVDRSPDSWAARWSLLDLFVLALVALMTGRLLGWRWAALAAVLLVLAQHEGAPRWLLAATLALALLARNLPPARLRRGIDALAALALALGVLVALPFAAHQLALALHPQLAEAVAGGEMGERAQVAHAELAPVPAEPVAVPAPPPPASPMADRARASFVRRAPLAAAGASAAKEYASRVSASEPPPSDDSGRPIQAGVGTPQWDVGNDYVLGWSGPVTPAQTMRLVIAPSWLVRLLRVLMVGLLVALLARLVTTLGGQWRAALRSRPRAGGAVSALLLALVLAPHPAHAQATPAPQLLNELRMRLDEPPKCAPACASLAQMQIDLADDAVTLGIDVAAGADVAVPLPVPDNGLVLTRAALDGHADVPLVRQDAQPVVRVERGVHRLELRYAFTGADTANLRFVLVPHRVASSGAAWTVDGIDDGRMRGDSLAFTRRIASADGQPAAVAQRFPPYVRVTRQLRFAVEWTVSTQVQRIAPAEGGFTVKLPLLPGEHPQGQDLHVANGQIEITFRDGEGQASWSSRLDATATLRLSAPPLVQRAEVWQIEAAPMWHVEAHGLPTSASPAGWRYQPLPGETLQVAVTRPVAVGGGTLAFDRVALEASVGERARESTLELTARSTRGGEHAITLAAGTELIDARRDGQPLALAVREGKLGLPLLPGTHAYRLQLRDGTHAGAAQRTPAVALGAPAANIDLALQLPRDRWVLWTWGPTLGPAVLYWPQLAVLLLAAWALARFAPTPLRYRHWLLLGLGFSAFAWSAYALVALWLIALGLRMRWTGAAQAPAARFNTLQVLLGVFSVLALIVLVAAVPYGLLGSPDMHVAGHGSSVWSLHWFADRTADALPRGGVFSLPLWVYKLAMLAWALWLANALVGWLRFAYAAWSQGGYWRRRAPAPIAPGGRSPDA